MGNGDGVQWGFSIQKEDSTLGSQLVVVPLCLTLSAAVDTSNPPGVADGSDGGNGSDGSGGCNFTLTTWLRHWESFTLRGYNCEAGKCRGFSFMVLESMQWKWNANYARLCGESGKREDFGLIEQHCGKIGGNRKALKMPNGEHRQLGTISQEPHNINTNGCKMLLLASKHLWHAFKNAGEEFSFNAKD
uniref:HDC05701 n=1 Tax=Drosophila melanogaster TaxID=7227 RepID=Q6IGQ3_DROME|nr:TPA_inf: HDC05701 [Drosophila melanogaster]